MSEALPKYSFRQLIEQQHCIRIPKIQRDYAEGRKVQKVQDIRQSFLSSMLQTVVGIKPEMQMDFIYGYNRKDANNGKLAFEPLDGQQRLTTLFLFYWLFNDGDDLLVDDNKSVFTYLTRISSEEFCDELVKRNAKDIINVWKDKNKDASEEDKKSFQQFFISQDWFKWGWRNDPTIQSMLIVLESTLKLLEELGYEYSTEYYKNLDNITFNLLDLDRFGLEDELYVKMNARGKELSDFDILKSTLEEEIQYQIQDGTLSHDDEQLWRRYMDKEWIDMMWDWRKIKLGELTEANIYEIENDFRKLLQRIIALQLFRKVDENNRLYKYCGSTNQVDLDRIIPIYTILRALYIHSKEKPADFVPIDFRDVMDKMNILIYKSNPTEYHQASELFDNAVKFQDSSDLGLMDLYLSDNFTRDRQTCFYAMEAFLHLHPASKIYGDKQLTCDFTDWMRFCRDAFINENISNLKIDKPVWEITVMQSIDKIIANYEASGSTMREFIEGMDMTKGNYNRVEKQIVDEEKIKLKLRNDEEWAKLIDKAESNAYFHGQIPFLLSWSKVGDDYDKELFKEYTTYISRIFPLSGDIQYVFYVALFCIGDFRDKEGAMMTFGKYKFRSWKACLRSRHADGQYAPVLHKLIDYWRKDYSDITDLATFLEKFIDDHRSEAKGWLRYAVASPETFWYAYRDRVILDIDGHHYIAQSATSSGHYKDFFLHYLAVNVLKDCKPIEHDSKDKTPFALDFTIGNENYSIQYNQNTQDYSLTDSSKSILTGDDDEILSKLKDYL